MSNLSDLLPAGAGGKQVKFVASGTLPSGQTIALNANGTVSAIGSGTAVSQAIPAAAAIVFNSNKTNDPCVSFDPNTSGSFVVGYKEFSNSYGTAVACKVTGTTLTFGTPIVFISNAVNMSQQNVSFNPSVANQIIVTYRDSADSNYGQVRVGTVSGTTISFRAANRIGTVVTYEPPVIIFDPSVAGKFVTVFRFNSGNGGQCNANTVTGEGNSASVSIGSASSFESGNSVFPNQLTAAFDSKTPGNFVFAYQDGGNGDSGTAIVAQRSSAGTGTSFTFGTATVFQNGSVQYPSVSFNPAAAGKFVIAYYGTSQHGYGILGTVSSGTAQSYATAVKFYAAYTNFCRIAFDPNTDNKFIVTYYKYTGGADLMAVEGTASASTVTFATPITFSSGVATNYNSVAFNPFASSAGQFVGAYQDDTAANDPGTFRLGQIAATALLGNTGFIGISDAAIANSATGSVTVKGGIATLTGGTYAVTVANPGAGNRYYIDGILQQKLNLREGFTYKFDQSAGSNSGHPLRFSTTENGTHAGGSEYTTGVTTNGVPGNAGAYTQIVVAAGAPTLYYYCSVHSLMGGTANTLTGIVANSNYYVQGDGTLSTTTSTVLAGKALSTTSINLDYTT